MKKLFAAFATFLILCVNAAPAMARVEEGAQIDEAIVRPLMSWVERQTGVTVPVLPRVIASRSEFRKILASMGGTFTGRPQALYVPGTVYVNNLWWDDEDQVQLSLLVHELVHHAQLFMKDKQWPCPDAREAQAYNLQNQWLSENNMTPFVRVAWIEKMSSCPGKTRTLQLAQNP